MSAPLLTVRDLRVSFRTEGGLLQAVDGVSFELRPGEVLAIVGESGSGKSVTAQTLMGLTRSRNARIEGSVEFEGKELIAASDAEMRKLRGDRVAMVFQDPMTSFNPVYRLSAQIAEAIRAHRDVSKEAARERAIELFESVGIPDAAERVDSYPHEFSGGMRQRAMIAMALALEPDLLIADEPVSSLDASIRGEILALLLKLRSELGLGVLVVTHDLGLAWNIADRTAVMYLGRIVEAGPTEDVLASPQHPYTQALLSVVPEIERLEPVVLTGEIPDPRHIPPGCRFHPRCPALADGRAGAAGVEQHCRTTPLEVLPASEGHRAACHLVAARGGEPA
jgi:oligopeptide/dipeptide ABC transporter ATP-binding protein